MVGLAVSTTTKSIITHERKTIAFLTKLHLVWRLPGQGYHLVSRVSMAGFLIVADASRNGRWNWSHCENGRFKP